MLSGPSGSLINRPVELGLRGATYVEVRSGLREGDRVLVPSGGP
jgi:multidrug efflux pump subunit AcrA (membrane-fusion protein)